MIREHIAALKYVDNLPKKPTMPVPKKHYTVTEWNAYQKELKEYNMKLEKHAGHENPNFDQLPELRMQIIN